MPGHIGTIGTIRSGLLSPAPAPSTGEIPAINPQTPPGADALLQIMGWAAWGVSALCVVGIFAVAARMAISHRHGEGSQHAKGLGLVLGACVLVGAASALVGAIL